MPTTEDYDTFIAYLQEWQLREVFGIPRFVMAYHKSLELAMPALMIGLFITQNEHERVRYTEKYAIPMELDTPERPWIIHGLACIDETLQRIEESIPGLRTHLFFAPDQRYTQRKRLREIALSCDLDLPRIT
ncbi:hypothetical protein J4464_05090 [Candidatus Woesearchaeota archaeon]|nr:hypothetical protein [Candidatus Woesearchaeota archaeon]